MIPEPLTRELLIDSCHSSVEAKRRIIAELGSQDFIRLLVRIAVDADDYEGDAPMQAAYFLSRASPALTKPYEAELLALLTTAEGYSGSVALTLGRMKSQEAKPIISRMLAEGFWPAHAYEEALAQYNEA